MNTIVQGLVGVVEAEKKYDLLPVLADALEESGFENSEVLVAMRACEDGVLWKSCETCKGTGRYRHWQTGEVSDCWCIEEKTGPIVITPHLRAICEGRMSMTEAWLRRFAESRNTYDGPQAAFDRMVEDFKEGHVSTYGTSGAYEEFNDVVAEACEKVLGFRPDFSQFSFSCSC